MTATTTKSGQCWICRNPGTTHEHIIKASDIREYFGTQKGSSLYLHSKGNLNDKVQSPKSQKLTSGAKLCLMCNTALSQPHDLAWQKMSQYLRQNWEHISKIKKIDLSKIFPGKTRESSLNVHLYFLKLFGCQITADSTPIDITPFSRALLQREPHPRVGLFFSETPPLSIVKKFAQISDIHLFEDKSPLLAAGTYTLAPMTIRVEYYSPMPSIKKISGVWHPSIPGKIIKMSRYHI